MIEIKHLSFEELFHACGFEELVNEYCTETANKAIGTPQMQVERYSLLDQAGTLHCIAAFDKNQVVGLAGLIVTDSQHYAFPIVGVDSFYLRKEWRKGATGLKLLREVKRTAFGLGSPGCTFMAPPDSELDKLCFLLGMTNTHKAYWCQCDERH